MEEDVADPSDAQSALGATQLRLAAPADAPAIAALHIRAWQWAYRGQLPDAFLDELPASLERRTVRWQEILSRGKPEERTWVAEEAGQIVGFASIGPSREADAEADTAELYALYLDQAVAGCGLGRMLLAHALANLRGRGYGQVSLWVLATNERARRFYAATGWQADGTVKTEQSAGVEFSEVRYRIAFSSVPAEVAGS